MMDPDRDIFSELTDLEHILSSSSGNLSHHNATVSPMDVQNMNISHQTIVSASSGIIYQHLSAPSPIYSNIRSPATSRASPGLAPSPASVKSPNSAPSPNYRYMPSPGRPPSNPGISQQSIQVQQLVSGGQVLQLVPNVQSKPSPVRTTKQILPKPIQAKGTPIAVRQSRPVKSVQPQQQNMHQNQYMLAPQIINQPAGSAMMLNQVLQPLHNGGYIIQQQPGGGLQLIMRQPSGPAGPGPPRQNQPTIVLQQQGGLMSQSQQVMRVLGPPNLGGLQLQQVQTPNGTAYIAVQSGGQVIQNGPQILQQVPQVVQNPIVSEAKHQSFSPPRSVKKIAKKPSEIKKSLDLSMLLKETGIAGDEDMFSMEAMEDQNVEIIPSPKQSPQLRPVPTAEPSRVPVSSGYITPLTHNQMKNASVTNSHLLEALQGSKVPRPINQSSPKTVKARPGAKVIVPKRDENATPNVASVVVPNGSSDGSSLVEMNSQKAPVTNGQNSPDGVHPVPPPQFKTIQLSVQNQQLLKRLQARVMQLSSKQDRTPAETQNLQKLLEEQQKIIALGKPVSSQPTSQAPPTTPDLSSFYEKRMQWQQQSQDRGRTSYLADLLRQPISNGVHSSSATRVSQPASSQPLSFSASIPSVQIKPKIEMLSPTVQQGSSSLPTSSNSIGASIPLTVAAMEGRRPIPLTVNKVHHPPTVRVKEEPVTPVTRKRPLSKTTLFEHQLKVDQNGALNPEYRVPFLNKSNACKRLLRYHVFYERPPNPETEEREETEFEERSQVLVNKFQNMLNKYRGLLFKESMRECASSEHVMIQRRFVADERSALERMRENARLGVETSQPHTHGFETKHHVKNETYRTDTPGGRIYNRVVKNENELGENSNYARQKVDLQIPMSVKSEGIKTEPYDTRTNQQSRDVRILLEDCMNGFVDIKEERTDYNELESIQNEIEMYKQTDLFRMSGRGKDSLEEDIDAQDFSASDLLPDF